MIAARSDGRAGNACAYSTVLIPSVQALLWAELEVNTTEWAALLSRTVEAQVERLIALGPSLLAALLIVLVGLALAIVARTLARRLAAAAVRRLSERAALQRGLEQGEMHSRIPAAIGLAVFWSVLLLFIAGGVEQLGIPAVSNLFSNAAYYLPRLLIGLLIVVVGLVGGNIASHWATSTLAPAGVTQAWALGRLANIAIVAIAIVVAADQVGIESTFLMLASGITLSVMLGGVALAFAVGCGPIVGNVLAAHYVVKRFLKGKQVTIDGRSGAAKEITATFVVLEDGEGETLVPARRFMEQVVRDSARRL